MGALPRSNGLFMEAGEERCFLSGAGKTQSQRSIDRGGLLSALKSHTALSTGGYYKQMCAIENERESGWEVIGEGRKRVCTWGSEGKTAKQTR